MCLLSIRHSHGDGKGLPVPSVFVWLRALRQGRGDNRADILHDHAASRCAHGLAVSSIAHGIGTGDGDVPPEILLKSDLRLAVFDVRRLCDHAAAIKRSIRTCGCHRVSNLTHAAARVSPAVVIGHGHMDEHVLFADDPVPKVRRLILIGKFPDHGRSGVQHDLERIALLRGISCRIFYLEAVGMISFRCGIAIGQSPAAAGKAAHFCIAAAVDAHPQFLHTLVVRKRQRDRRLCLCPACG